MSEKKQYMRPTPQNRGLGALAKGLRRAREGLNYVPLPEVLGGGAGNLLLGESPEEIEAWSYGSSPFKENPSASIIPIEVRPGREQRLLDTAFLPAAEAYGLAKLAGAGVRRAAQKAPLGTVYRGGQPVEKYSVDMAQVNRKNAVDQGLGIYTTSDMPTAQFYADRSNGVVNTLHVAAPKSSLLNRDLPLSEQPQNIIKALKKAGLYEGNESLTGANFYHLLVRQNDTPGIKLERGADMLPPMKKTNEILQNLGIRGMVYKASHVRGRPTENYVLFSGDDIINKKASGGMIENTTHYRKIL